MKYNRETTYNYLSNSLFQTVKSATCDVMFYKRPNLLARDLDAYKALPKQALSSCIIIDLLNFDRHPLLTDVFFEPEIEANPKNFCNFALA